MPIDFEKCIAEGGHVTTKVVPGGKYIHICYKGKKSYSGEVKTKKKK